MYLSANFEHEGFLLRPTTALDDQYLFWSSLRLVLAPVQSQFNWNQLRRFAFPKVELVRNPRHSLYTIYIRLHFPLHKQGRTTCTGATQLLLLVFAKLHRQPNIRYEKLKCELPLSVVSQIKYLKLIFKNGISDCGQAA